MIHVALLRGINVGGKNKLPMAALAEIFSQAGAGQVSTYIQSGNVLFDAPARAVEKLGAAVEKRITERFGFSSPVILRSVGELEAVARGNPFLRRGAPPETLHVAFLAGAPVKQAIASLDPKRSPPDELELRGREVFLRLPNGVARTKLTNAYFDRTLATTSTVRNWRTVLALVELAK
jgi:uncharacterized protein (DUF1697 family)